MEGRESKEFSDKEETPPLLLEEFKAQKLPTPSSLFYGVRTTGPLLPSSSVSLRQTSYASRESRISFQKLFYGRQHLPLLDRLPVYLHVDGLKYRQGNVGGFSFNKGQQCKGFAKEIAASFAVFNSVVPECEIPLSSWKSLRKGSASYAFLKYPDKESGDEAIKLFNSGFWKGLKNVNPSECRIFIRLKDSQRFFN